MKTKLLSTLLILCTGWAHADLEWFGTANAVLGPDNPDDINESSFTTALQGSAFLSSAGYFVQLLRAGGNGVIDAIPATVSNAAELESNFAAQGDDSVISTRWIGAGRFADTNGKWNAGNPWGDANDGATENYFVRTWVGISPDSGTVSTGGATAAIPGARTDGGVDYWWYGNSAIMDYTADAPGAPPAIGAVDFTTSAFTANQMVQVIPEPSTWALLSLGGVLAFARVRRKK
jgi:hypothetical protein